MRPIAFDIEVKTADELHAGTDDDVQISMVGPVSGVTKDTGMLTLAKPWFNDHERGDLCKYQIVQCRNPLEKIESLTVLKNGIDNWHLEYIKGRVSFLATVAQRSTHLIFIIS